MIELPGGMYVCGTNEERAMVVLWNLMGALLKIYNVKNKRINVEYINQWEYIVKELEEELRELDPSLIKPGTLSRYRKTDGNMESIDHIDADISF